MKGTIVVGDVELRIDSIELAGGALRLTAKGAPKSDGSFAPGDLAKVYDKAGVHVATFLVPDTVGDGIFYRAGVSLTYRLPVSFRDDGSGVPKVVGP